MINKRYEQQIEVDENGCIGVRDATIVVVDGVDSPPKFHRKVLEPGSDLTNESVRIKAVAPGVWTPAIVAERAAFLADPETVDPVVPGYVRKTKTRNVILANGAVVQAVLDIVEEDGAIISEVPRPNRLVDVEADVTNESDQVKVLSLAWTQDVIDAANARRAAILAKVAEDVAREESARDTALAATATSHAEIAAQAATKAISDKVVTSLAVAEAGTEEELATALANAQVPAAVASAAIAEAENANAAVLVAEDKATTSRALVETAIAKTAADEAEAKAQTDAASDKASRNSA